MRFPAPLLPSAAALLVAAALITAYAQQPPSASPATVPTSSSEPQPPYNVFPPAEAPYFRVRYEAPATQPAADSGVLTFAVNYTVWVPPGVKTLRGVIVHQHGCGEGSCKSGLTGAFDLHWQALARAHDCALLSPAYEQPEKMNCQLWCDPRNGSDAAFQKALTGLGAKSGHPELATVPWALWGHSGGGHWAGGMVLLHPERIAAAWLRSGVPPVKSTETKPTTWTIPEAALQVPVMCNLGTKEGVTVKEGRFAGVWPGVQTFFTEMRSRGALIGVAVDPLTSHECGNQRYLAIPWLDACLTARLPGEKKTATTTKEASTFSAAGGITATATTANLTIIPGSINGSISSGSIPKVSGTGTVTLVAVTALYPMPADAAWLAPLYAGEPNVVAPVPAAKFTGDLKTSVWLPNEATAWDWAQYVKDTAVPDTTPPPAPTHLQVTAIKGETNSNQLTWEAAADLESGLAGFIIERDGQVLAKVPDPATPAGKNIFGRPLFQNLQYSDTPVQPLFQMTYTDAKPEPGKTHQYRVIAVNTVGLKSE